MVIVVIHLKDKTASILSILYEGIEYTRLEQNNSKKGICHILYCGDVVQC